MNYNKFIQKKTKNVKDEGFELQDYSFLFDFQRELTSWAALGGKRALFADCGLGKTPMQLAWADSVHKKCNKPVLILTPLAVAQQTKREGEKFGIDVHHSYKGDVKAGINVTNYEKLDHYNHNDFCAIVLDESSILKNYSGKIKQKIIEFMESIRFRLLCTATPSPNDYMELGNSSEALDIMRRVEMLSMFFVHDSKDTQKWRLKGHANKSFWQWMAGWSRAIRKPSDLGFEDNDFVLPDMNMIQHTIESKVKDGNLFVEEAVTLNEQRAERKETINERCEQVAEVANSNDSHFLAWCSFNDESKILTKKIDGAVEICGSEKDKIKEDKMLAFSKGEIKVLVTKPSIAGFGMNWQHCNRMSFFPSHSHEQFYQATRRCWRFGQKKDVECHIVTSEAESRVLENMKRKERQSDEMFSNIIKHMKDYQLNKTIESYKPEKKMEIAKWM